jgi:GNAT superfamily N-acetyltransferase
MTRFHNRHHGDTRDPAFWLWEYVEHLPGKSVFLAARERNRVVGTQGMIPINLRVGGEVVLTGKSEHSLIDPALRGRGLWRRLYRQALDTCHERGMTMVWGFTPVAEARRGLAALGFSLYEVLEEAVMVLDVSAAARVVWGSAQRPWSKVVATLGLPLLAARGFLARRCRKHEGSEFELAAELRKSDDFARFNERRECAYPGAIRLEFDGEYLDWRLQQHPLRRLQVRFLYENNDIVAFAVVNAERRLRPVILNAAFTSPPAGRVLLARLFDEFARSGAGMVLLAANRWNPLGRDLLEAAARLGAVRRRARSAFAVRALDERTSAVALDPTAWQLSLLWFEGYAV